MRVTDPDGPTEPPDDLEPSWDLGVLGVWSPEDVRRLDRDADD